jgi:hypothetical protein
MTLKGTVRGSVLESGTVGKAWAGSFSLKV